MVPVCPEEATRPRAGPEHASRCSSLTHGVRPAHLSQYRKPVAGPSHVMWHRKPAVLCVCVGGGVPRFSHVTQPGCRREGLERQAHMGGSHDTSCDAIPEVHGRFSGVGRQGAAAACCRRARRVYCIRPGLRIWGRAQKPGRSGEVVVTLRARVTVWLRVPGSRRLAGSVRLALAWH